jgi:hypothetical protein
VPPATQPRTGQLGGEGDVYRRHELSKFLRIIRRCRLQPELAMRGRAARPGQRSSSFSASSMRPMIVTPPWRCPG